MSELIKGLVTCRIGSNDYSLFVSVIEQGIDSHLEAFTRSEFHVTNGRLSLDMHSEEIPILLRRLRELENEESDMWANDIEASLNGEFDHD